MKIELKTKSVKELVNKCKSLNWNLEDVKISTEIWTDAAKGEDYVKLFIINSNK